MNTQSILCMLIYNNKTKIDEETLCFLSSIVSAPTNLNWMKAKVCSSFVHGSCAFSMGEAILEGDREKERVVSVRLNLF